ncbi:hypothetical protein BK126_22175 [Paenibacillus sp. FSL H7-0326]|uniref:hypothetical protein n=1 Tax=Paenibacillus sp. FSL H7-0326 TaxID=1921144 RepID=UPI00096D4192|nr:hypothetical protein [Paenibacillus sp. FSL H7-0326]OMC65413.1 hypothetical protein BK126_22175 [Paenibacillus sp. FSL H7-0326]
MSSSYTVQLTAAEAAFLFQLMDISEGEAWFKIYEANEERGKEIPPEQRYAPIAKGLEDAGLLAMEGREIILDVVLLELLNSCKYSSAVTILRSCTAQGQSSITYGFISGTQVIEMKWSSETGEVLLTALEEGLETFVSRMGDNLLLPDVEEQSGRISMERETLNRLVYQLSHPDDKMLQSILQNDQIAQASSPLFPALMEACASARQQGTFEAVIRGTELRSATVYYIGSPQGNWLFIQDAERDLAQGYPVTEPEFIQTVYLITTRTLSALTPN